MTPRLWSVLTHREFLYVLGWHRLARIVDRLREVIRR